MQLGDRLGPWSLSHFIDEGQTGEVWLARAEGFRFAALKILRDPDDQRRAEFQAEVDFLRAEADNPGVMPLLDADASAEATDPWYAMPTARTLFSVLGYGAAPEAVVAAFVEFTATMAGLHARGYCHIDLRPMNLFRADDRWVIGDAGGFQRLGSQAALQAGDAAGEVRIGKSLWRMLTPAALQDVSLHIDHVQPRPLTGLVQHPWVPALDSIIARATALDPRDRLAMDQIHRELVALLL